MSGVEVEVEEEGLGLGVGAGAGVDVPPGVDIGCERDRVGGDC